MTKLHCTHKLEVAGTDFMLKTCTRSQHGWGGAQDISPISEAGLLGERALTGNPGSIQVVLNGLPGHFFKKKGNTLNDEGCGRVEEKEKGWV